jgi:Zn-dependent protease
MAAARDFRMFFFAEAMFGTESLQIRCTKWGRLEREKYEPGSAYVKAPHNFDTHGRRRYLTRRRPSARPLRTPRVALDHSTLTNILLTIPVLLFALVAHEWAHAYAALKQGDPTAYELGRLTFNPIKHIDPFMTIILPIVMLAGSHGAIALGGAKPCPVNPSNFRNYKRGDIIVSLAGVTMNMLLAIASAALFLVAGLIGHALPDGAASVLGIVQQMLKISVLYNSLLLFFNLLPIPPLDGSHVIAHFLPAALAVPYKRISRFGLLILVGLLYFGGNVMSFLLTPVDLMYKALMHPVLPFALGLQ